jgi:hypothetical protein
VERLHLIWSLHGIAFTEALLSHHTQTLILNTGSWRALLPVLAVDDYKEGPLGNSGFVADRTKGSRKPKGGQGVKRKYQGILQDNKRPPIAYCLLAFNHQLL